MTKQTDTTQLEAEINAKLNERRIPHVDQKPRTQLQRMTLLMSWAMVIIMVGSVVYAAVSALGWL